jgi:hypothetical protein
MESPPLRLVELFGAPGAGKTTLAMAAAGKAGVLTRHQLGALWRKQPLGTRAVHVLRGFAHAGRIAGALRLVSGARIRKRPSLALLARVIAKTHWLKSRSGVILLDQGFLQDLWSILYMSGRPDPDPAILAPLIRAIYDGVDARIVFIDVKPETSASRVGSRTHGHSRLDGLPKAELYGSLARAAQLPVRIVEAAKAAGCDVVTLDGSEPSGVLVNRLLPLLQAAEPRDRRFDSQVSA